MVTLVIDAGNTRIKAGVFKHNTLVYSAVLVQTEFLETLIALVNKYTISRMLLSDVSGKMKENFSLNSIGIPVMELGKELKLPYKNLYQTKETLGADRMALVAGAMQFFPDNACLVIDAGTCVTYDLLNSSQEYLGGNITPGLHMRLNAMHAFTGKLPLPEWEIPSDFLGRSTDTCLLTGAYFGLVGEIEYLITRYQKNNPDLKVLLTGGDGEVLAKSIKTSIFAHEQLLLYGLNKILTHNAE